MNPAAQRRKALRKANETRVKGKEFRDEVARLDLDEGRAMLAEFLENEERPDAVSRMRLDWFLLATHRVGVAQVAHLLRAAGIRRRAGNGEGKRKFLCVGDLTERERMSLVRELRRED